jgi:hypothetical protein
MSTLQFRNALSIVIACWCAVSSVACSRKTTVPTHRAPAITPIQPLPTVANIPTTTSSESLKPRPESSEFLRWYTTQDCVRACFAGLVPGVTTLREAEQLLRQSNLVDRVRTGETSSDRVYYAKWHLAGDLSTEPEGYATFEGDALQDSILTQVTIYSTAVLPKLGEVLDIFGNPSEVYALSQPDDHLRPAWTQHRFELKYPSRAVIVGYRATGDIPRVDRDLQLNYVLFYMTSRVVRIEVDMSDTARESTIWQGLMPFLDYCGRIYGPAGPCGIKSR